MNAQSPAAGQRLPRKRIAKGPSRPKYLDGADCDQTMIIMLAILSELLTLRDRVDTHEHLLDREAVLPRASLESFRPDPELEEQREAQHLALLRRVFRVLRDEFQDDDVEGLKQVLAARAAAA